MNNQKISMIWAFLYGACAALGFIPNPVGALSGFMIVLSVAFFIPPAVLVYRSIKNRDFLLLKKLRYLSLIWLGLTTVMVSLNFLSVEASEAAGKVLYWLLILVSSPMICSQTWIVPIFLWGCLLTVCLQYREKKEK
jgi:hypothetical protein